jgi:hypothetical protein
MNHVAFLRRNAGEPETGTKDNSCHYSGLRIGKTMPILLDQLQNFRTHYMPVALLKRRLFPRKGH